MINKTLLAAFAALAIAFTPSAASADEPAVISGEIVDSAGSPVPDLTFRFSFNDTSNVTGTTDKFGKFLSVGKIGSYTFRIIERPGDGCLGVSIKGTFASQRETFRLVIPKKVEYLFESLNSKGLPVYGTDFYLSNPIFAQVSNPDFGNPSFTCTYGARATTGTAVNPTSKLVITELNIDAMANWTASEGVGRMPSLLATHRDSVSGASQISIPIMSLKANPLKLVVNQLPDLDVLSVKQNAKLKTITIQGSLQEQAIYAGLDVPRTVQLLWRWKNNVKNAKWVTWRFDKTYAPNKEGVVNYSVNLNKLSGFKTGSQFEVKIIGSNFGSMSKTKSLRLK